MLLDRVAKFGVIGAIGISLISLGAFWLMEITWANRVAGVEGKARGTVLIIAVAGTALAIFFLFIVIGGFIDRELEARGIDKPDE